MVGVRKMANKKLKSFTGRTFVCSLQIKTQITTLQILEKSSLSLKICNKLLTAQFISGSCEQVVEDMKGPLIFGLANGTGFLQQV